MKNIYIFLLVVFTALGASAQSWDVPETNAGLITKITASWCGPCGGWGWDGYAELIDNHHDDHICMALYASSSSLYYTPDADVIAGEIGFGGYPNFAGNGEDVGTSYASVGGIIDNYEMETVKANAAYEIVEVTEDNIKINVKVEFFEQMDGEFVIAAYMIEDEIVGYQNGQGDSAHHHLVFRGAFTHSSNEYVLTTEGANAGEVFTKTLSIDRSEEWNLDNSEIATVLWVKDETDPTDLIYVNGTKEPQAGELEQGGGNGGSGGGGGGGGTTGGSDDPNDWTVGIEDDITESMELYPNPAKDVLNVKLTSASDFNVEVSDLLGKVVLRNQISGKRNAAIDVSALPEGLYMIRIETDNNTFLDRVIVK
jgi:hypothetical protein